MRTGIALGRPLVPKLGQRFEYWGGGTPPLPADTFTPDPIIHLDAWRYSSQPRYTCSMMRRLSKEERAEYWATLSEGSKRVLEQYCLEATPAPGGAPSTLPVPLFPWIAQPGSQNSPGMQMQIPPPRLFGLGLGKGKSAIGLGSSNNLGAAGFPLLASSIVSIPLQAAATWVGFHTGSKETGWLSAAGYVVGIVGAIGTLVGLLGLVVGTAAEVAQ